MVYLHQNVCNQFYYDKDMQSAPRSICRYSCNSKNLNVRSKVFNVFVIYTYRLCSRSNCWNASAEILVMRFLFKYKYLSDDNP